jgi:hypothetical protein
MKGNLRTHFNGSNSWVANEVHHKRGSIAPLQRLDTANCWASGSGTNLFLEDLNDKAKTRSSSAFQLDHGKMLSVIEPAHHESDRNCILASCLKTDDFFLDSDIHIHGDSSTARLMWTMLVVPICIERNLLSDGILAQWDENASGAFVLYGPHQSLDDGDTSVLANSTEPLFDIPWFCSAPRSEFCRDKLTSLIGNQMSGRTSHRMNGVSHERNNLIRSWLLLEDGKANDCTGEMVNHHNDPPTNGQTCAKQNGAHGTQNPAVGTVVISTCQT